MGSLHNIKRPENALLLLETLWDINRKLQDRGYPISLLHKELDVFNRPRDESSQALHKVACVIPYFPGVEKLRISKIVRKLLKPYLVDFRPLVSYRACPSLFVTRFARFKLRNTQEGREAGQF